MESIEVLCNVANNLLSGESDMAKKLIHEEYPFSAQRQTKRNYSIRQMFEQFVRDGFIDRYSGKKLLNPGLLLAISEILPEDFPYHPHWSYEKCHHAYWEYYPTIDHLTPIALGGADVVENWVTTSMIHNSAKSSFTLEQLGWQLFPEGNILEWDGLSGEFILLVERNHNLLNDRKIKEWYKVTTHFLGDK